MLFNYFMCINIRAARGLTKRNAFSMIFRKIKKSILPSKELWFYGCFFTQHQNIVWNYLKSSAFQSFHTLIVVNKNSCCAGAYRGEPFSTELFFYFQKKIKLFKISFYRLRSHDFMVFCWYFFDSKQGLSGRNRRNPKLYLSVFARWAAGSITVFLKKSPKSKKT